MDWANAEEAVHDTSTIPTYLEKELGSLFWTSQHEE